MTRASVSRLLLPGALLLLGLLEATATACPKGQFSVFVQDPNNPRNECRACPAGYERSPQSGKGHKDEECFKVETAKPIKLSVDEGGLGPICKKGWWNTPDRRCYVCPKPDKDKDTPYAHDGLKTASTKGVCTRTLTAEPIVKSSTGGADLCEAVMRDSLPNSKSRPKWVKDALALAKTTGETALKGVDLTAADLQKAGEAGAAKLSTNKDTEKLLEIARLLYKNPKVLDKLFAPKTMCSVNAVLAEMNALGLKTKLPFFVTISFTTSVTAGVSGQYGAVLVTNLTPENTKFYRFAGAALTTELASVSAAYGVQGYFDQKTVSEAAGFGLGAGFGVGSPWGPGVGIDTTYAAPPKFVGPNIAMRGFGPNGNIGVGLNPIPVSVGVSGTYTFEPK